MTARKRLRQPPRRGGNAAKIAVQTPRFNFRAVQKNRLPRTESGFFFGKTPANH